MNKVFLSLLLFLAVAAQGQDIATTGILPADGAEIKAGVNVTFVIQTTVNETLPIGSQLSVQYAWDANPLAQVGNTATLNAELPMGNNLNFNATLAIPNTPGDSATLTVKVVLNNDKADSNNTLMVDYKIVDQIAKDLSVSIVSPTSGTEIRNWSTVNFTVGLTNVGYEMFNNGSTLVYVPYLNGQQQGNLAVAQYGGAPIAPYATGNITLGLTFPRDFPTGNIEICAAYYWATVSGTTATIVEGYVGNNMGCVNLSVVPNSINEDALEMNELFYAFGKLHIGMDNKDKAGNYRFEVYSANGQKVAETTENVGFTSHFESQIALPALLPGVYMLSIYADGEYAGVKKFFVQ
jgi:hypothetical protein